MKKHAHMGCAEVGARGFCCPPQLRERGPYLGTIGDWEPNARNPTQVARVLPHSCLYSPTHAAGSCLCWMRAPPDPCPRRSLRSGTAFSRAAAFSTTLLSKANLLHVPQCSPSSSSIHFGIPRPRHRFSTAVARDVHFAVPLTLQSSRAHHVVQVPDSEALAPAHLGTRAHSHSHNQTCACTCVRL